MSRIIGLDISSTTIGLAVIDQYDGYYKFHVEYFKPPKTGHIFERLNKVNQYITQKITQFSPDEVIMEDFLLGMPRKTSANTIALLAVFNRTVGMAVYNVLKKSPKAYSPISIRKALTINDKMPSKEEVPEFLEKLMKIKFPWITKINKKTKQSEKMVENYDMSDGLAAAFSYILTGGAMIDNNMSKAKTKLVKIKKNAKRVEKKSKPRTKKQKSKKSP